MKLLICLVIVTSADDNWGVSPGNESLHSENLKTF